MVPAAVETGNECLPQLLDFAPCLRPDTASVGHGCHGAPRLRGPLAGIRAYRATASVGRAPPSRPALAQPYLAGREPGRADSPHSSFRYGRRTPGVQKCSARAGLPNRGNPWPKGKAKSLPDAVKALVAAAQASRRQSYSDGFMLEESAASMIEHMAPDLLPDTETSTPEEQELSALKGELRREGSTSLALTGIKEALQKLPGQPLVANTLAPSRGASRIPSRNVSRKSSLHLDDLLDGASAKGLLPMPSGGGPRASTRMARHGSSRRGSLQIIESSTPDHSPRRKDMGRYDSSHARGSIKQRGSGLIPLNVVLPEPKLQNVKKMSMLTTVKLFSSKEKRVANMKDRRKKWAARIAQEKIMRDLLQRRNRAVMDLAAESFYRYFRIGDNEYDLELLMEGLADFGIRAHTRDEKLELVEVVQELEGRTNIDFEDFCAIIENSRTKVRSASTVVFLHAWRQVDAHEAVALKEPQVMKLLQLLGRTPEDDSTHAFLQKQMAELRRDEAGMIPVGEVEFLVQQLREAAEVKKRRREREIQEECALSLDIFREFRNQLVDFHTGFMQLDVDGSGCVDVEEVWHTLREFGLLGSRDQKGSRQIAKLIEELCEHLDSNDVDFTAFLTLIRNIREFCMQDRGGTMKHIFDSYDIYHSGVLDLKKISCILCDLGMQPRSVTEQDTMASLIEESDIDGNGELTLSEFEVMTQRIVERLRMMHRRAENEFALTLNIDQSEIVELRRSFESLDTDNSGALSLTEVKRAISYMHSQRISDAKLGKYAEKVNFDENGELDFVEFLRLLSMVFEEHGHADVNRGSAGHSPTSGRENRDDVHSSPTDELSAEQASAQVQQGLNKKRRGAQMARSFTMVLGS
eukprot:gnl/TRDRNA2_/TRDRNA2_169279_c0_seq1.p1 gnl/TRDRNA2_/TRDRNA2_169279_c0~~gnl/TRDRNA2_/TRDRNA2_169279_c0_seq1.p1  ORF type:complete len:865 (-),score=127.68 gnl/TRDRNA2_/TRDRNA2_169279_c0_seq1:85-2679(-)